MNDFANRTIRAIADDARRPLTSDIETVDTYNTRTAIDMMSDDGLERVYQWLDGMRRQFPLNGSPLFEVHRILIEALRDDVGVAIAKREGSKES